MDCPGVRHTAACKRRFQAFQEDRKSGVSQEQRRVSPPPAPVEEELARGSQVGEEVPQERKEKDAEREVPQVSSTPTLCFHIFLVQGRRLKCKKTVQTCARELLKSPSFGCVCGKRVQSE